MTLKIIVLTRSEFEAFMFSNNALKSIVISISSREAQCPVIVHSANNKIVADLKLNFNDTESTQSIFGGMTVGQAVSIAEFIDKNYDEADGNMQIIVQSGGGLSRGAGVAGAMLKYYNGDDVEIMGNPRYTPNMRCYTLVFSALIGFSA